MQQRECKKIIKNKQKTREIRYRAKECTGRMGADPEPLGAKVRVSEVVTQEAWAGLPFRKSPYFTLQL